MIRAIRLVLIVVACAVALAACRDVDPSVTVTNSTQETIRVTGNCIQDDAYMLAPGQTVNQFYLGAQCRIDDGDGLHGMLGCVTLKTRHTVITVKDLRDPPGLDQCWGSGPSN